MCLSSATTVVSKPDAAEEPALVAKASSMTREEVRMRAHPDTFLLIIIGERIYDCTRWQAHHPGGALTIRALCGKDATEPFNTTHPAFVKKGGLKGFYYAELKDGKTAIDKATIAYRELTVQMEDAGLFETDYTYYYFLWARLALMFSCVVAGVTLSDKLWVHALSGAMLGLFWQQTAFVGHDLGHNGISHDRKIDSIMGLFFGNFCTGIGIGWWKRGHNVHHIVTNSVDYDPDIQHLPVFAVSPRFLESPIFSTWYNATLALNKSAFFFVGIQHWIYYPVMAFARFNLYVQSLLHAFGLGAYDIKEKVYRRDLQIATLAGFWTWLVLLTLALPTWTSRVVFFILAHNVAGILHVQITLSHFAMPSYEGVTYDDSANGFLFTQMAGSMDVDCPLWMDWFHGGLHLQVVHHLWPRIPRHNLRKVQKIFISFCKEYPHLPKYHRYGFVEANCVMLHKLKETAKTATSFSELFEDSINMSG
mmetsp:Transcript_17527/g.31624  ORF Transcript_17527/g.31624 Transcript_17527/m.31624 type:complete len:478 (-) Transcript_17527:372-1805(-)|eukprot:CAMPEP_0198287344 /NCGR_PEP_ID=MMETSP1449-20131203/6199_1 /TAXON_ID=420275 /ORGANISM="Attheya septentrionalis, Strain CCMP2084" /LENGTH=477 /DNA_ID=CAMNT_0043985291 /DNA_START=66 /DNA_END=1499 /DNA_ORIENTATION=+